MVKFGGKDSTGVNRSSTEDLGWVLEHGADDWTTVDLGLREFVSNAIDRAIEEGEEDHMVNWITSHDPSFGQEAQYPGTPAFIESKAELDRYRTTANDYTNVVVEVVTEAQVRAKTGTTRIFVPLVPEVLDFFNNLGKWFLHFSEPELLNQTILPKKNRNLKNKYGEERRSAVIYRRGVRVREFESSNIDSLFDYNLENLKLDESRRVDDWYVQTEAARAIANGDVNTLKQLWQSLANGSKRYWEHDFQSYGLEHALSDEKQKAVWMSAFEQIVGENAVLATDEGKEMAARKGFKVVTASQQFVQTAEKYGIRTPAKVLTDDDKAGRTIFDSTPDAVAAVEFAWELIEKHNVANERSKPIVKTFRKIMDGGSQTLGFYKDGVVYINQDIAGYGALQTGWHNLSQQLLVTAFEEVTHHVTGSTDNSRDFQDFLLQLIVYMAKERMVFNETF